MGSKVGRVPLGCAASAARCRPPALPGWACTLSPGLDTLREAFRIELTLRPSAMMRGNIFTWQSGAGSSRAQRHREVGGVGHQSGVKADRAKGEKLLTFWNARTPKMVEQLEQGQPRGVESLGLSGPAQVK